MTSSRRPRTLLALLCLALLAVGCSSSQPEPAPPAAIPPSPGQTFETFERLARALPNLDGPMLETKIIDWRQTFHQAGQPWPQTCDRASSGRHPGNMARAVGATSVPWSITLQQANRGPDDWQTEFGIALCEIEGTARSDRWDPALVLQVSTSAHAIEQAVTTDPTWSADLVIEQAGPYQVYDWGDGTDPTRTSGARIIGQAGQLAVDGEVVVRTEFRRTTDAFTGATSSIGDRPHVLPVLDLLASEGVAGVVLSEISDAGSQTSVPPIRFVSWELLGYGSVVTSAGEPGVTVVLAHRSEREAHANAARFDGIVEWSRLLQIDSARTSGSYSITTFVAAPGATVSPMQAARIGFDEGLFLPLPN